MIKIIILAALLTGCNCGSGEINTTALAYRVGTCTDVGLDYDIIYNAKGRATDVTCYKPGTSPTDTTLEYVQ